MLQVTWGTMSNLQTHGLVHMFVTSNGFKLCLSCKLVYKEQRAELLNLGEVVIWAFLGLFVPL